MRSRQWKTQLRTALIGCFTLAGLASNSTVLGQNPSLVNSVPAGLRSASLQESAPVQYLQFPHFSIPFDIDRNGRAPNEVYLWVSPDGGQSWMKYASASPEKRAFDFHAAAEGEYLFAVQTRDEQGDSALAAAPPMRIMIDTTKPVVDLTADMNASGRLAIDCRLSDSCLAEDSIRVSYSLDGKLPWEDLSLATLQRSGDGWLGHCEIDMPRCREVIVKLKASDKAQNTTESITRYVIPRTAAATGLQLASQGTTGPTHNSNMLSTQKAAQPSASPPQRNVVDDALVDNQQPVGRIAARPEFNAVADGRSGASSSPSSGNGATAEGQSLAVTRGGILWEPSAGLPTQPVDSPGRTVAGNASRGSRQTMIRPDSSHEELPLPKALGDVPREPAMNLDRPLDDALGSADTSPRQVPVRQRQSEGLQLNDAPSLANEVPEAQSSSDPNPLHGKSRDTSSQAAILTEPINDTPELAPPGMDDAYHSRSRTFSLDYTIEALRGSAVADIELWGTEDGGTTWQKWGSDPDRQSPFEVQVGNDGFFGFRMVIIGTDGLIGNRPHPGDTADMWINVDTEQPAIKLTRAVYGEGPDAGKLVIAYACRDNNLHERPISLYYSERPNGPWVTIASGQSNSGIYLWKAEPGLPQQVYLRVQAVDRAGNMVEHCLDLPVNLRGLTPRGRIQGFRPLDAQ
jgi:hypothetical protein